MRKIAIILFIVFVAVVQGTDTPGSSLGPPPGPPPDPPPDPPSDPPPGLPAAPSQPTPKVCSREHCSGTGNFMRCGCGCHNCCVKKYGCRGGVCRRFFPTARSCYCYRCQNLPGAASKKSKINKDSTQG